MGRTLAGLLALALGTALANGGTAADGAISTSARTEYLRLDQDGDGGISWQEAQANLVLIAWWDRLDRNHDGYLDEREFARLEIVPIPEDPTHNI